MEFRDTLQDKSLSKSELYEIADEMEDCIGTREFIDSIEKALTADVLRDTLHYIARQFDM